jgi:hypothetical protein
MFFDLLDKLLNSLLVSERKLILCGDFNIDLLQESSSKRELLLLMNSYGLDCFINSPTRFGITSASCIDHVFSNLSNTELVGEIIATAISDHEGILLTLPNFFASATHSEFVLKRIFKEPGYKKFEHLLSTYNWDFIYNEDSASIDAKFTNFLNKIVQFFDLSFPKRRFKIKPNNEPEWLNLEIKAKRKHLRELALLDGKNSFSFAHRQQLIKNEKKAYHKLM